MSYFRYLDSRFGDLYEIYLNDETGEFEQAIRNLDALGRDPILYTCLKDIPQPQRNVIENLLWKKQTSSSSPQS